MKLKDKLWSEEEAKVRRLKFQCKVGTRLCGATRLKDLASMTSVYFPFRSSYFRTVAVQHTGIDGGGS